MRRLLVALVFLVAVPGSAVADPVPAPVIKLVKAGKGPLRPLRFTPTKGAKHTVVMTSQESSAQGLRGKLPPLEQTPAVRMTMELEVTDVSASGDLRYEFVYRKVEVLEDKTATADVVRQMNSALGGLVGMKGHAVLTNRGIVKESDLTIPQGATPELRQTLEGFRGMLNRIVDPLPEEPIGVGAKWDTSITVIAGELTVQQQASHELVEFVGTRGKIKIVLKQQGKGSGSGNLTTAVTGTGETSFDLTRVLPAQARLELRNQVELDFEDKRLALLNTSVMTLTSR